MGNLKYRDKMEYVVADERIMLKYGLNQEDGRAWTSLIWRRIERIDGLL